MTSGLFKLCRLNGELCHCLIIGEPFQQWKTNKTKQISLFVSCHNGVVTVKKLNVQKCATRADKYLFCKVALSLCFKPRLSAKLFTWNMIFLILMHKKTHFHKKGFALSAVLKVRVFGTWKWPNYLIIILSVTIDRLGEFGSWPCSPQLTTYL